MALHSQSLSLADECLYQLTQSKVLQRHSREGGCCKGQKHYLRGLVESAWLRKRAHEVRRYKSCLAEEVFRGDLKK